MICFRHKWVRHKRSSDGLEWRSCSKCGQIQRLACLPEVYAKYPSEHGPRYYPVEDSWGRPDLKTRWINVGGANRLQVIIRYWVNRKMISVYTLIVLIILIIIEIMRGF